MTLNLMGYQNEGKYYLPVRIYSQDIDGLGILHHSNYLRIAEKCMTELFYHYDWSIQRLKDQNICITIRESRIEYSFPVFIDETIIVESYISDIGKISFDMKFNFLKNDSNICSITNKYIIINNNGRPIRIPNDIKDIINYLRSN